MPTTRRRRQQERRETLTPDLRHYLQTGQYPAAPEARPDFFLLRRSDDQLRVRWQEHRDEIMADFIRAYPGSRPYAWWRLEAPERRQRLGGIGTPAHEVLAYWPTFRLGIPASWVSQWDVEYYNGRMRDIHGQPIGTEYHEGNFEGQAIDPDDPPRFESQAAYLDRLGLLAADERAALPDDAFEPEVLTFADDDGEEHS